MENQTGKEKEKNDVEGTYTSRQCLCVGESWAPKHTVGFPPFAISVSEDGLVIVGGGGGSSKTGVPNQLVFYSFKDGMLRRQTDFDTGSDTPFSVSLCSPQKIIATTLGDCCQVLSYASEGDELAYVELCHSELLGFLPKMRSRIPTSFHLLILRTERYVSVGSNLLSRSKLAYTQKALTLF
jgi:hypothetical protein